MQNSVDKGIAGINETKQGGLEAMAAEHVNDRTHNSFKNNDFMMSIIYGQKSGECYDWNLLYVLHTFATI